MNNQIYIVNALLVLMALYIVSCKSDNATTQKPMISTAATATVETYFEAYPNTYIDLTIETQSCNNRAEEVFDVYGFESLMDKASITYDKEQPVREVALEMTKKVLDCSGLGEDRIIYSLVLPPDSVMQHITISHPNDIIIRGVFYEVQNDFLSNRVNGVEIPLDLFEITKSTNAILVRRIQQSLAKSITDFERLINFDCGGGAACYDLGSVVLQIADVLGEDAMLHLSKDYHAFNKRRLKNLLYYGFEYGDKNEARKNTAANLDAAQRFEMTFPRLYQFLN